MAMAHGGFDHPPVVGHAPGPFPSHHAPGNSLGTPSCPAGTATPTSDRNSQSGAGLRRAALAKATPNLGGAVTR